jgi:hypothetical protein
MSNASNEPKTGWFATEREILSDPETQERMKKILKYMGQMALGGVLINTGVVITEASSIPADIFIAAPTALLGGHLLVEGIRKLFNTASPAYEQEESL